MRTFRFILFFSLVSASLNAQLYKLRADTEFLYTYGGVNFDEARAIKEIPGGGYILAGTSSSFGQGNTSVYLVKTDNKGKHLWSSLYGGGQNDWAYSIEVTPDSGFFVAGFSNSFLQQSGYDAYYFRTDKNGNLLWQKTAGGDDWDFIYGCTPMPSGGYLLCGESYSASHGGTDAWLVRITDNGDTLWTKKYGGAFDEVFYKVIVMHNQIYAVGKNSTNAADTVWDGWVVKLDTNGKVLNEKFISNTCSACHHFGEVIKGITQYDNISFSLCGNVDQPDSNAIAPILGRMDTSLTFQWLYMFVPSPQGRYEAYEEVVNVSYGTICVIGTKMAGLGGTGMFFVGFDKQALFITDYAPTDGGSRNDYGYSGIYSSQGNVIGVGSTKSTGEYCANPNFGQEDIFLVRYDSDSIHTAGVVARYYCFSDTLPLWQAGIKEYSTSLVSLFPNPADERAILRIETNDKAENLVNVYSVLGEELLNFTAPPNKDHILDLSAFLAGSYYLKVLSMSGRSVSILRFVVSH